MFSSKEKYLKYKPNYDALKALDVNINYDPMKFLDETYKLWKLKNNKEEDMERLRYKIELRKTLNKLSKF